MSSQTLDESTGVAQDIKRKGQEIASTAQARASNAVSEAEYYIVRNPWIAIGCAVAVGAAIGALLPRSRPEPSKLHAVRDWLGDAYQKVAEQLPDVSDVQAAVRSVDVPATFRDLRKKLQFW